MGPTEKCVVLHGAVCPHPLDTETEPRGRREPALGSWAALQYLKGQSLHIDSVNIS